MTFAYHPSGVTIPLHLENGHLYVEWQNTELLFTRSELKQVHENSSHPSSNALINALKTLPMDEIVFNYDIEVEIMWIDGDAIIHIIDRVTRYSMAKYLNPQTTENAWNSILEF